MHYFVLSGFVQCGARNAFGAGERARIAATCNLTFFIVIVIIVVIIIVIIVTIVITVVVIIVLIIIIT